MSTLAGASVLTQVAAGTAAAGLATNVYSANKQADIQKEQNEVSSAAQMAEDASRLRSQARKARIQRARVLQASEALGGGSRDAGALASIDTQVGVNQARVGGQQGFSNAMSSLNNDLAQSQVIGQLGKSTQQLGMQAFTASGGFDNLFKE